MVGFKNRYMVMEVFLDPNKDLAADEPIIITQFNLSKAIKDSILLNFGECGLASSLNSFQVKYVNPITKLCIIRASREEYQKVWAAITMVRSIGNCPVIFNLLDLSGNIRSCKGAALSSKKFPKLHLREVWQREIRFPRHSLWKNSGRIASSSLSLDSQMLMEKNFSSVRLGAAGVGYVHRNKAKLSCRQS